MGICRFLCYRHFVTISCTVYRWRKKHRMSSWRVWIDVGLHRRALQQGWRLKGVQHLIYDIKQRHSQITHICLYDPIPHGDITTVFRKTIQWCLYICLILNHISFLYTSWYFYAHELCFCCVDSKAAEAVAKCFKHHYNLPNFQTNWHQQIQSSFTCVMLEVAKLPKSSHVTPSHSYLSVWWM